MDFNGFPSSRIPDDDHRSHSRDRDRDRYYDGYTVKSVRHRDLSPVRPRPPREIHVSRAAHERFKETIVNERLTQSSYDEDFTSRFKRSSPFRRAREESPPKAKTKLAHSAPTEMFRVRSKADIRKEAYASELEAFHRSLQEVPDFKTLNDAIRSVKNFDIAEKYFWEIYKCQYEPDKETYQMMIKAALNEDNLEKASYFSDIAHPTMNVGQFFEDLITRYLETGAPLKAVKVLQLAGPDFLGKFLAVAEHKPPPPFVFSKVMDLFRHKGEVGANIPAAEALLGFVHRNRIPVEKVFYMRLADIYYERGFLPQAYSVLDKHLHYEIKQQNGLDKLDTHDWTPRAALMMITDYLVKKKRNDDDFLVVTGKGIHSKDEKYLKHTMREFILYNQGVLPMGWDIFIDPNNSGMLIFKNRDRRS